MVACFILVLTPTGLLPEILVKKYRGQVKRAVCQ